MTIEVVTVIAERLSQTELKRLDYRMTWEDDFRKFLKALDAKKPVVVCGDLNRGQKIILAGFGAGLTWGASILEW